MNNYLSFEDYRLRAPEPEDIQCMMQFENCMEQWSGNCDASGPYSLFQIKRYIESSTNNLYDDKQLRLIIENSDRKIVGIIDICTFDPFANKAEVGIIIAPEYRNKGIGAKILNLFDEYCFAKLGVHMLYAYIDTRNTASINLFLKCGYTESGHLKDWGKAYGQFFDVLMLQLINPY